MTNMSFLDQLNQAVESLNNQGGFNDEQVDSPYKHLKHPELQYNKENKSFMVRILPPTDPAKFFAVPAKTMWLNVVNKGGKKISMNAILPFSPRPGESMLSEQLAVWADEARVPDLYNKQAKPKKVYFVNVIQVQPDQQGIMQMERDQQGNPIVRLLKIPVSGYQSLIAKIGDPMYKPEGSGDYGIIGIENAYPVRISKPAPGGMSYSVDVFEKNLGALPQGWENLAEDLEYQATPIEEVNPGLVQHVIDVVNGTEGQGNEDGQTQQNQQQNQQSNYSQQPQQQGGFNQPQYKQAPQNQGYNQGFNQGGGGQPQQQQQNNQQQQNAPQGQSGFQQQYQQHQQQQEPAPIQDPRGTQMPQQNFNQPVDMGDGDPYSPNFDNHMPTDFASKPNVAPENGFGVQDTAPQQTQQNPSFQQNQTQTPPPTQTQATPPTQAMNTGGKVQNVDDVLAQMQNMGK